MHQSKPLISLQKNFKDVTVFRVQVVSTENYSTALKRLMMQTAIPKAMFLQIIPAVRVLKIIEEIRIPVAELPTQLVLLQNRYPYIHMNGTKRLQKILPARKKV